MKSIKVTRTLEIMIEKHETVVVRSPRRSVGLRCPNCGCSGTFSPVNDAAQTYSISHREIFKLIESESIGFAEYGVETVLICTVCIEIVSNRNSGLGKK
jgi:hypothetical protein